ncbi:MAG: STAS domain-containing protein [Phycisphaerae bacterium]|nr:STAS domain-containing protein [Phycisphaerae bacterium]
MRIKAQDYENVTVIELQGEFDSDVVDMFQKNIMDIISKQKSGIVLSMTEVSFVDSAGLEQLLWARDYCNDNNCELRLAGLDENCSKIFEITRLAGEFDKYTELTEAVKSFT